MNTATNPATRWLFPGQRAGQPLNAAGRCDQLREHGYPTSKARPAALGLVASGPK
ncbi:hypothetical protein [Actinomadura rudentiformis]|uniref:hypothetical protein n=1 Tax=Actinomadura rudentiformis TaxID=359158 RepID=UPI00178C81D2|nr:hypothetical protein [Actinomadura rudentiformis]